MWYINKTNLWGNFMSEIHDNIIKSYFVDFENQNIVFNTVYHCNDIHEITIITFNNVMAYFFKDELNGSIIFDIEEISLEYFINENKNILDTEKNYGWPFPYKDEEEFIEILNKNKQKYYVINSSYGLNGWILADEMKIDVSMMK